MSEHQNVEYKQSWRDEYLKWICGFANAQGGKIFVGLNDDGMVTGVSDYKKLMEDIPNKAVNHLGLVVDVNLRRKSGKHYIEIAVPVSSVPVSYHGVYHYRSGSTKQELKGISLQNLLLKKIGVSWEDIPVEGVSFDDLNMETIQSFITKSLEKGRVPGNSVKNVKLLLRNLNLISDRGQLTNAAILLFGKNPLKISVAASFKIGRFGKSSEDLLFQDVIETNIFDMPDKVMEVIKAKYLIRPISYDGLLRNEPLEYPEDGLREAVLNAIIHKDYSSTYTFLRIYDNRIHLWNPGALPEELNVDELKQEHSSYPRNKNIANVFFKAGYVESWGRGTNTIVRACLDAGMPEPIFKEEQGGMSVVFLRTWTGNGDWYMQQLEVSARQMKALLYIQEHERISNAIYQKINEVSKPSATLDLIDLVSKRLIDKVGTTGRGTFYRLTESALKTLEERGIGQNAAEKG